MKKMFLTILLIIISFTLSMAQTAPSGSGTSSDPYLISTSDNIAWLQSNDGEWGKYYKQTADIDLSGLTPWTPIGNTTTSFSGNYDGDGHTLEGLTINTTNGNRGFFGIFEGGSVKDLGLTNVSVSAGGTTGALIGQSKGGTITNCYTVGSVTGNGAYVGGLIGECTSDGVTTVSDSYSECDVTNVAESTSSYCNTGGLIGFMDNNNEVTDCYATGNVSLTNNPTATSVGGLIGAAYTSTISKSYSTGNVTGGAEGNWSPAGGFIGYNSYGTISECYSRGDVEGYERVGGFVGYNKNSTAKVENCYSYGNVSRRGGSATNIGGFVGFNRADAVIENSYSLGNVTSDGSTDKGFVGQEEGSTTGCFFDKEVSNQNTDISATGETTANMKTQSTFTAAGWDFSSVWEIVGGDGSNYPSHQWDVAVVNEDTEAPTPNPMTFASVPTATGSTTITMTATEASDPSGVEYYFECATDASKSSDWQESRDYTAEGLTANTSYSFRVKARDKSSNHNETAYSDESSATTDAEVDTEAPTPDPMTFASVPTATGSTTIIMTATEASDPSGVEYYFECTTDASKSSDWQESRDYTAEGLTANTSYSFRVKARDKSSNHNETAYSDESSATTEEGGGTSTSPTGSGTESDPYQISTFDDLKWIAEDVSRWDKHYIQTANITASPSGSENWDRIGDNGNPFTGSYDGQNHTIDGLVIITNSGSTNQRGLFGVISGATIKNVGVTNISLTNQDRIGALIGESRGGTISNCYSTGSVTGDGVYVGGLIGVCTNDASSTVEDSYSECTVTNNAPNSKAYANTGGLIGFVDDKNNVVTNCYATGDVTMTNEPTSSCVGGLIGSAYTATISKSYSTGNVTGGAEGNWSSAGGFIGFNDNGTISECYSKGNVEGYERVGGFVGYNKNGTGKVENCYSFGSVTRRGGSATNLGGFVGYNRAGATVENSYSIGNVTSDGSTDKGFVGNNESSTIASCFFDKEASNQTSDVSATGETTENMKKQSTFESAGWNFTDIWEIVGGDGANYPSHKGSGTPPPTDDTEAPTPNPMTFASVPTATGPTSITMTATEASDPSGVEYYFECTTDASKSSDWQDSRDYTAEGLALNTSYSFRVKARDKSSNHNETAYSDESSATTDAEADDTEPPTPNPMRFDVWPYALSSTSIRMVAKVATDPSGVEYYFKCKTDLKYSSKWQDSREYIAKNLKPGTEYRFKVIARDKSKNHNVTTYSAIRKAVTDSLQLENIVDVKIDADSNNVPDRIEEMVRVQGIVTTPSLSDTSLIVAMQDTSAGIVFYSEDDTLKIPMGTKLDVTGTIIQYNGVVGISVYQYSILGSVDLPAPIVVTPTEFNKSGKVYDAMVVKLEAVSKVDTSHWPIPGTDGQYFVTDGIDTVKLLISKNTDIADSLEVASPMNVTGVITNYLSEEMKIEGYQLWPRAYSDFEVVAQVLGEAITAVKPSGSGTETDPYLIDSLANLSWLTQTDSAWNKYYLQTSDINASVTAYWDDADDNGDGDKYNDQNDMSTAGNNEGWSPIGTETNFFLGSYDGGNYKIDSLNIKRPNSNYIGFFGNMRKDFGSVVSIKNLGLTNVKIIGGNYVAGFIGQNFAGTIKNCYSTGNVSSNGDVGYVAGFVGYNNTKGSLIERCYSEVNVTFTGDVIDAFVGGFAGRNRTPYESGAVISKCYSTGNVTSSGSRGRVGGFVGQQAFAKIINCYSTSNVHYTGAGDQIGGFTGRSYTDTIAYCYFAGTLTADSSISEVNTKGFVGTNNNNNTYIGNFLDTLVVGANQSAVDSAAQGLSTTEMKTEATFIAAGWDFNTVWEIIGDNYPTLKEEEVVSDIETKNEVIPNIYSLEQNYPNPFNPSTVIKFSIPKSGHIELSIYNILGQKIITLINKELLQGTYEYQFDAGNLTSGIYLYKLQAKEYTQVKKMILLK